MISRSVIGTALLAAASFSSPAALAAVHGNVMSGPVNASPPVYDHGSPMYSGRGGPPKGWRFAANPPDKYQTWTDIAQELPVGTRCSIISTGPSMTIGSQIKRGSLPTSEFATVMQGVSAETYRGKRVRLSAQLSTVEVTGQAELWMRVDGQNGKVLSFDDMASRPVSGTKPWQRYEIVLDVPMESTAVAFGFLLAGSGKAKAARFSLDIVEADTAITASGVPATPDALPKSPANLDLHL